ncbi:ISL3 family transposase [Dactylosporangium siamense]|uniref:ISL3 family transposase n=1 Tax=Dactylosporangium siamense TaxID=685454 RepID=A0A919UH69_9ACTN|nr:ISL3 family transposase [Dactylosporangium siamense]GIG50398.1 ISL3 family transposase [Dactylosporangium siamense]
MFPVAGRSTRIVLWVRRFFCDNAVCEAQTFAEQIDGLTRRWSRVSDGLRQMLTTVGLALAGRAGARMAAALGMPASRHRLLRLVRALPDPVVGEVAVLGVDDFAVRRGHHYGTVLIDCETHRVVDLLLGRDAGPLTAWLQQHPAPRVICRDRASAYAEAARTSAPEAVQVADRFHLWQNLAAAVERCAAQHKACLDESDESDEVPAEQPRPAAVAAPTGAMAERRRAHHALVHELLAQGAGFRQIARHLGWSHHTVSRYAHAATWQEMMVGQKVRPSLVDSFKPYLIRRINEGCLKATTLHREIRAQGFAGSYAILRKFVEQYRSKPDLTSARRPPSVRQVTGWICRRPDDLADRDTVQLQAILQRCPLLRAAAELVRWFADMLTHLRGQQLTAWIAAAETAALPGITKFATGLTADLDAVTAGLTLPFSSGPVEGNVNRIKMIKRQMYGRAGFDLLRKRVLLA